MKKPRKRPVSIARSWTAAQAREALDILRRIRLLPNGPRVITDALKKDLDE